MSLRSRQSEFAVAAAKLILKAQELGYEVTLGDAYRDPRVFGNVGEVKGYGNARSCHKLRLAIDLNLFIGGAFRTDTESHRLLGEWWESQGGSWGGRFNDANHYSFEYEGIR
jgi:hypothetical protein